jgi:uncharacterized protein YqhQ
MSKIKKRFGGMSFGGIFGGGTIIFSKRYKLFIFKDRKTKTWKQVIKKKKLPITFHIMFLFFLLFDGMFYIMEFKSVWVNNLFIGIGKFLFGDMTAQEVRNIFSPIFSIPLWVWELIVYVIIGFLLLFLYFFWLRGVRKWHGCEHKVIEAAINDDIYNAEKYTPISNKCGGTYMLTMYVSMGAYWVLSTTFFHISLPVGVFTFVLLMIFIESRVFHKYNKIGICFGRWLQKKITVSEPEPWQLKLGIGGMKKLIDVEYNNRRQ